MATARRAERLEELVRSAPEGKAHAVALDVTDPESVQRAVDAALERFGRRHLVWLATLSAGNPERRVLPRRKPIPW